MGIPIKAEHLRRYRDIAKLLMKYGWYDLVRKMGLDELLEKRDKVVTGVALQGEQLTADLEKMGPTFIKLGQLLSTRPDILPLEYTRALDRLQDRVAGFPFEQVSEIITAELGKGVFDVFSTFDPNPLAAASLGQVHTATLPDGGQVAVKVQRPGIRESMMADLDVLAEIAWFLDRHTQIGELYQFGEILAEFRYSLMGELDYRQERRNLITLKENLKEFDAIVIPGVIQECSTERVLTMDFIEGKKITALTPSDRMAVDTVPLLDQTFRAYLRQILVDGFFHADPHPGNVILTPEGQIGIVDLGMVARISPGLREKLIRLLLAMGEGQPEDAADIAASMGDKRPDFDRRMYRRRAVQLVTRYQHANIGQVQAGSVVMEFMEVTRECGIRVPRELTMLGKTLLHLDQVARVLDPEFDPNASIRTHVGDIMLRHMAGSLTPRQVIGGLLELKEIAGQLPRAVNAVLDQISNNELRFKVDAVDETRFVSALQKIANRITMGLLLASLVIGAALLARIPTSFVILGYPALPTMFFVLAAAGAVALTLDILVNDERWKKRK